MLIIISIVTIYIFLNGYMEKFCMLRCLFNIKFLLVVSSVSTYKSGLNSLTLGFPPHESLQDLGLSVRWQDTFSYIWI